MGPLFNCWGPHFIWRRNHSWKIILVPDTSPHNGNESPTPNNLQRIPVDDWLPWPQTYYCKISCWKWLSSCWIRFNSLHSHRFGFVLHTLCYYIHDDIWRRHYWWSGGVCLIRRTSYWTWPRSSCSTPSFYHDICILCTWFFGVYYKPFLLQAVFYFQRQILHILQQPQYHLFQSQ